MSWPTDGEPRFIVRTVTGYGINDPFMTGRTRSLTGYMILDRADIHRCVYECQGSALVPDQLTALLNDPATIVRGLLYLRKLHAGGQSARTTQSHLTRLRKKARAS